MLKLPDRRLEAWVKFLPKPDSEWWHVYAVIGFVLFAQWMLNGGIFQ